MRFLLEARLPHEPFNAFVRDGTAGEKLGRILEDIKPQAVYFVENDGRRCAMLVVDMPDPSRMVALAEPWFLVFQADVRFRPAMTPEDLQKAGLEGIAKKWG
jgi:hypothetical protein